MVQLDVRGVPPRDRFERIMGAYEALALGDTLALTVDHDPECMYFTLAGTRGAKAFSFEYLERGPLRWRVQVTKLEEVASRPPAWTRGGERTLPIEVLGSSSSSGPG